MVISPNLVLLVVLHSKAPHVTEEEETMPSHPWLVYQHSACVRLLNSLACTHNHMSSPDLDL